MISRPDDSTLVVRRSIHIKASPDQVWKEFTSMDRMKGWWGFITGDPQAGTSQGQYLDAYEPRLGGKIRMAVNWDGARVSYGGEIKIFETAKEFTFENDWIPNRGWKRPTYLCVRLTPALGGTLVELFHFGFEHTGGDVSAEHAGYEQGWGMTQLAALKRVVEGG
jgi:uncharacterized protein YndB with AHSA1/START domain